LRGRAPGLLAAPRRRERACFFAFDLLVLDGEDWRRYPLIERKARLKRLLGRRKRVLRYVEHLATEGRRCSPTLAGSVLEGIVSKRRDLGHRSGRSAAWLKIENPAYKRP
jgi:bifunctional non-homologous end joining protein LigD